MGVGLAVVVGMLQSPDEIWEDLFGEYLDR